MCYTNLVPISTKGELAKTLASVKQLTVDQLDISDGKKDGKIDLLQAYGTKDDIAHAFMNGGSVMIFDNGNGKIDGEDFLICQTCVGINDEFQSVFIGGRLSRLIEGYETEDGQDFTGGQDKEKLRDLRHAKELLPEIHRRKIILFSNLIKPFQDIVSTIFNRV